MSHFNNVLGSDETLFRNAVALDFDFMPKLIPYRENEQHAIADCIRPLFKKRSGRNLIITGEPGIGKTVACRHVTQEIEEETEDILTLYVNCWQHNTTYKVFLEFCDQLGYAFTQNKKTEELFIVIKGIINKKSAVFVFDEIDKAEEFDFLYTLLEEIFRKSVVLITNYKEWITELDNRIKSRLVPDTLEFKPYSPGEIRGILLQRREAAFYDGIWDEEAFDLIVQKTAEIGDIRLGLTLLRESGTAAEDKSARKITKEHALKAIERSSGFTIKSDSELEEDTQKILAIVKLNPDKKIGELYRNYHDAGGVATYKTFQRKIQKLAENKFILVRKIVGGAEGSTTIVSPYIHKKLTDF